MPANGVNVLGIKFRILPVLIVLLAATPGIAQDTQRDSSGLNNVSIPQGSNPLPGVGGTGAGAATPTNSAAAPADDSIPTLRPPMAKDGSTPPNLGAPSAGWPANDTLPLGVDQFTNPVKLPNLKGPVGKFVQLVTAFTANKPCINCVGVQVKIQNLSSSPIILDGEHAEVSGAGVALRALSEDSALASSGRTFTKKQKEVLGLVAAGTLGLLEPVTQDHFTTSKIDFPVCYGPNETRRRLEDRRFGKRVLLPGEDTEGIIFFPGDKLSFDKITIPLLTYPTSQNAGNLDILASITADTPVQTVARDEFGNDVSKPPAAPKIKQVKAAGTSAKPSKSRLKQKEG
ncbi:MAG: hypothetical protein K2X81_11670 [Candidatus Obscuribacterales bacterium]|nr:hypothetical protein [Candidatus Obscuribacterales bacterium]